jgi:hypothetical protein
MSAQGTAYWERRMAMACDKETEKLEQKSKAASDALWRTQQMLASVMPNNSG